MDQIEVYQMRQFGTIDAFDTIQFGPLKRPTKHDLVILTLLLQPNLVILSLKSMNFDD